jgi:hypothetical protein
MLYAIIGILVTLWLIGLATSYTLGGYLNLLLAAAIVMVLLNSIRGKPATKGKPTL